MAIGIMVLGLILVVLELILGMIFPDKNYGFLSIIGLVLSALGLFAVIIFKNREENNS